VDKANTLTMLMITQVDKTHNKVAQQPLRFNQNCRYISVVSASSSHLVISEFWFGQEWEGILPELLC